MVSEGGYATSQLTNENYDYADHYMRDLKAYSNYMANFKPGYWIDLFKDSLKNLK